MGKKAVILHVGANKSPKYLGKLGPIFPDGTFRFIPIPETAGCGGPSYRNLGLADYVPAKKKDTRAHPDPEFQTFTYGDRPESLAKMGLLLQLEPGDYLFFLSSLEFSDRISNINPNWNYYLIGYFEIKQRIYVQRVTDEIRRKFGNNAHVKINDTGFWLFKGTKKSALLHKAVQFSKGQHPQHLSRGIFRNLKRNSVGRWWQGLIEDDALGILWEGVDKINSKQSVIAGFKSSRQTRP